VRPDERVAEVVGLLKIVGVLAIWLLWLFGGVDLIWLLVAIAGLVVLGLVMSAAHAAAGRTSWRRGLAREVRTSFPLIAGAALIAIHEAAFGLGPQWLQAGALLVITVLFVMWARGDQTSAEEGSPRPDHGPF
jgi:hypothetical protein